MKIISFLGFSDYRETTYSHPNDSGITSTTPFFQEALVEFYQPEKLYIFLTSKVKTEPPKDANQSNWDALQARLQDKIPPLALEPIEVPEGGSPEDSWQIFDKMTACLDRGDRVIFDITHSFRSIPVIALLAISYLRTVRHVTVEGLVYGAFDPSNPQKTVPTYDLGPMLSLLDWIAATDRFVKVGDGIPLAELLQTAVPKTEMRNNPTVQPLGSSLSRAGKVIGEISRSIALARPLETLENTNRLEELLAKADAGIDQRAKPFNLIKDQLAKEYGQFALPNALETENLAQNLWLQFKLIEWYVQRGQTLQAMTLASEWLISYLVYQFGVTDLLDKHSRTQVNYALNNGAKRMQKAYSTRASEFDQAFQELPDSEFLSQLWHELTLVRNSLAHVGMNKERPLAKTLQDNAKEKLFPQLAKVASQFDPSLAPEAEE